MKIIRYRLLSHSRYKIFLDNNKEYILYEEVIIKYKLLDREIDNFLLDNILLDNEFYSGYYMAIKYLDIRLRSIKEIKNYLLRNKISSNNIDKIINKLIKNKLLDDDIFIKSYINDKIRFTNMGKYKIIYKLNLLVDNKLLIDKYISSIDNELWEKRIYSIIDKYLRGKDNKNIRNKTYNYLINLGYDKDIVINILNNYKF